MGERDEHGAAGETPNELEGERSRTITWADPRVTQEAGERMDGLDLLRAITDGTLPAPPMATLMGFHFTEVERGRVVAEATPGEFQYNPNGTVHGGFAATLLDSVMGCAVHTKLNAGVGYTTLDININYVRGITSTTGTLHAEGRTIHVGGRIATAEGRLTDAAGRIYAHGTTTCLIFAPRA